MTAYRQSANPRTVLFCPRCNELLDQVDFGVDMCPRCEGFWIGSSVLELSNRQWPAGPKVWWRNELRCPMCATTGVVSILNARESAGVIIDHCSAHGVWLDRGELARVMRNDPSLEDLDKLRENLAALEPTPDQLEVRRERWRGEQEERARLAEIERRRIEHERVKREAEEAEAVRLASEDKLRQAERLAAARTEQAKRVETERLDRERAALAAREAADAAASSAAGATTWDPSRGKTPPTSADATPVENPGDGRQRAWSERALREAEERREQREADERRAHNLYDDPGHEPATNSEPKILSDRTIERARLQRDRDSARQRLDWLQARIDSLEFELATARHSIKSVRDAYAQAEAALSSARAEGESQD